MTKSPKYSDLDVEEKHQGSKNWLKVTPNNANGEHQLRIVSNTSHEPVKSGRDGYHIDLPLHKRTRVLPEE